MKTPAPRHFLAALAALSILSSSFLQAADPSIALERCSQLLSSGRKHGTTDATARDAATALGILGGERAVAVLAARYREEKDDNLRLQIVRSLGQLRLSSALPTLEAAKTDPYRHTPRAAERAISIIKGERPLAGYALSAACAPDACSVDSILERCTKILIYSSDPTGTSSWASKRDAVITLGLLGDERAVPVLADQLYNAENQQLRTDIVRALGWINSPASIPALEKALHDPYIFVRKYSSEVLKQITSRAYAYDNTGEAEGRERVQGMIEVQRTARRLDDLELDTP